MALTASLLGGCAGKRASAESQSATAQTTTASAEITITDIAGRMVTLPAPAQKLVGTHNPTLNQAVILGGGGKYLVGFGNKNMAGNLNEFFYPELKDVTQIGKGKEINFEACVALGADLAILPERFADQVDKFEEVGIKAAVVLPSKESFDTIKSSLSTVATLVGEEEKAEKIISFFDGKINNAKEIAKQADASPPIAYLGGSTPGRAGKRRLYRGDGRGNDRLESGGYLYSRLCGLYG